MSEFVLMIPELVLGITMLGIVIGEIGYHGERWRLVPIITLVGIATAFLQILLVSGKYGGVHLFNEALIFDSMALFLKMLFLTLIFGISLIAYQTGEIPKNRFGEFFTLAVAGGLACCVLASANDILVVLLALQLANLSGIFLCSHSSDMRRMNEATLKYFLFNVFSSMLFLVGVALLLSYCSTTNISEIKNASLLAKMPSNAAIVAIAALFFSLCFQIAAFPLYLWFPDAIEGTSNVSAIFLTIALPIAGFIGLLRIFMGLFIAEGVEPIDWSALLAVVSGATMLIGSFLAVRQSSIKRLLAYLVIAQNGFLLLGLVVPDPESVSPLFFGLVVQLFSLMGIFGVLSVMRAGRGSFDLADLRGVISKDRSEAIALLIFLGCLIAIPPLPGFIARFLLVSSVAQHHWYALSVTAVVASILGVGAFAKVAFAITGEYSLNPAELPVSLGRARRILLLSLLVPTIALTFFAQAILSWADRSLQLILW